MRTRLLAKHEGLVVKRRQWLPNTQREELAARLASRQAGGAPKPAGEPDGRAAMEEALAHSGTGLPRVTDVALAFDSRS
jgi:hypothetical protein